MGYIVCSSDAALEAGNRYAGYIKALGHASDVFVVRDGDESVPREISISVFSAEASVCLKLTADLIDPAAEIKRLEKDITKSRKIVAKHEKNINNPKAWDRIPEAKKEKILATRDAEVDVIASLEDSI